MSALRKSDRKRRQTQLSFTPLPSSPAASQYPEQIQRRAASVRYDSDFSSPSKKRRLGTDSVAVSPAASVAPMLGQQKIQVVVQSPAKGGLPTPAASSQTESRTMIADSLGDSSEDDPNPARKSRPKSVASHAEPILSATTSIRNGHTVSDYDSEEDIIPARSIRRLQAQTAPIDLSSDEGAASHDRQGPITPKRKKLSNVAQGRVIFVDGFSDEEDTEVPTEKLRQKLSISPKTLKDPFVVSDEGDAVSSEDDVVTPIRRRRNTTNLRSSPTNHEAKEDSPEDLQNEVDDLQDTSDIEKSETRTPRRQDTSARSIRQQKLEELRRRRAGIPDDSEVEGGQDPTDEDEASEVETIQEAIRRGDDLDQYEEDFVDDENETIGVDLGRAGVPLEFTYHANKKTIDHFTTELEWMVHNKINPAFDRYDEIYLLAHDKLDTEFQGFAGSRFISSVWRPNFDKSLKTRPELYRIDIPTMHEHRCDACNRSNHPPKSKVTFTGKPYDRKTLEPIGNNDESEDDSEDTSKDEESSASSVGEDSFLLGRFCCANAEMAHALYHWRYALNQNVLEWLANEGYLTPEKIIERERKPQKKRQKIANKIVDGMESTGVMRELYKQFKENLAAARDAKPVHFSNRR